MTQDPSSLFSKNNHGHYIIEVVGQGRTGKEEAELIEQRHDERLHFLTRDLLIDRYDGNYDACHRIPQGERCRAILIPGETIPGDTKRSDVLRYAQKLGYRMLLAEVMLRIQEQVSAQWMREMNFCNIVGFHEPIRVNESGWRGGRGYILNARDRGSVDGQYRYSPSVSAPENNSPSSRAVLFAFLEPEN